MINKDASVFRGTILAPSGSVEYHNPATFEGAIIAKNIDLHSAFNVTHTSFDTIPEPSTSLLFLMSLGGFFIIRRRKA